MPTSWQALPRDAAGSIQLGLRLACEAASFTPRCRHFLADTAAAAALVRAGHAVSGFHPTATASPGTVLRPLAGNPLRQRAMLAWRAGSAVAGYVDDIHASVCATYQALVDGCPRYSSWWTAHGACTRDP